MTNEQILTMMGILLVIVFGIIANKWLDKNEHKK